MEMWRWLLWSFFVSSRLGLASLESVFTLLLHTASCILHICFLLLHDFLSPKALSNLLSFPPLSLSVSLSLSLSHLSQSCILHICYLLLHDFLSPKALSNLLSFPPLSLSLSLSFCCAAFTNQSFIDLICDFELFVLL